MGQLKRLMFFGGSREINDDGKPTPRANVK
jgi:hypothetical protein